MNNLKKITTYSGSIGRVKPQLLCLSWQRKASSIKSLDDIQFLDKKDPELLKCGRGGRSSFSGVVCTVFGASGFTGRTICSRLGKYGTQLVLPYRGDPYFITHLKVTGDLGQIYFTPFELTDEESIRKAVKHSSVVINLIGRDFETKRYDFFKVNTEGAERIARISKEMGVKKFIHVSALNSNMYHMGYLKSGGSLFLKSKGESEVAVKKHYPNAVIFRPSDIWGWNDRFIFYYMSKSRHQFRKLALPYKGDGIWKQPVFVKDFAAGVVNAVYDPNSYGNIYEAVGPRRYELGEMMDWFARVTRRDSEWGYARYDMKYDPMFIAKAFLYDKLSLRRPIGDVAFDRIERDAISDTTFGHLTLRDLGVTLTLLEDRIAHDTLKFKAIPGYREGVGEYPDVKPPPFVDPYLD